ncbi:DUF3592 domain-containing protein [Micromonospora sp. MH99]|uniref:DUF3592 domain-containing protein n=1 Tax=Micromonospora sp. MH99 TaxID=1945510 RepID=UPI001F185485|nr:DUF3592 domain-containing protein [Micromonospora sp. MH99]MCF0092237.1 hypothetical protein [Micromonospora sp. MH99]
MTRRRRQSPPPAPTGLRPRTRVLLTALPVLLVGVGLVVGAVAYRWRVSSEADRLRAEGVRVTAYVSDRAGGQGRGSGVDRIEVSYLYESRSYSTWIPCAGGTGCHRTPGPRMDVWVDPDAPGTFVAANGHTDGSLSFLMSWTIPPVGLLLAAVGTILLVLVVRTRDEQWR